MCLRLAASAFPGNIVEMQIPDPTADLPDEKLWGWGQQSASWQALQAILMPAQRKNHCWGHSPLFLDSNSFILQLSRLRAAPRLEREELLSPPQSLASDASVSSHFLYSVASGSVATAWTTPSPIPDPGPSLQQAGPWARPLGYLQREKIFTWFHVGGLHDKSQAFLKSPVPVMML